MIYSIKGFFFAFSFVVVDLLIIKGKCRGCESHIKIFERDILLFNNNRTRFYYYYYFILYFFCKGTTKSFIKQKKFNFTIYNNYIC